MGRAYWKAEIRVCLSLHPCHEGHDCFTDVEEGLDICIAEAMQREDGLLGVLVCMMLKLCHPTSVILASPPRTTAHLDVLPRCDPAEASAIKFAHICEDHSFGRHV